MLHGICTETGSCPSRIRGGKKRQALLATVFPVMPSSARCAPCPYKPSQELVRMDCWYPAGGGGGKISAPYTVLAADPRFCHRSTQDLFHVDPVCAEFPYNCGIEGFGQLLSRVLHHQQHSRPKAQKALASRVTPNFTSIFSSSSHHCSNASAISISARHLLPILKLALYKQILIFSATSCAKEAPTCSDFFQAPEFHSYKSSSETQINS